MLGKKIHILRNYRALSQEALAEKVGVSKMAISRYENELDIPSSGVLVRIIRALETSLDYLLSEEPQISLEFRKRNSCTQKTVAHLESHIRFEINKIVTLRKLFPDGRFKEYSLKVIRIQSLEEVEEAANKLRKYLGMGEEPVSNLVELLEDNGIVVLFLDLPKKCDGIFGKADDTAFIVISNSIPADRQRFTIAHELGHMVLEIKEGLKVEDVCNHFAGAFLINRDHFLKEIGIHRGSFSLIELKWLKRIYSVSMASIVERAKNLGIIDNTTYVEWQKIRSAQGWRVKEPVELPKEVSTILERNVLEAFIERYVTTSQAATLLDISVDTFINKYLVGEEKVIA